MRDHADKRTQVNVRHGGRKNGNPVSLVEMARLVLSELTGEMVSLVHYDVGGMLMKFSW